MRTLALVVILGSVSGPCVAEPSAKEQAEIKTVAGFLTGSFSSEEQAKADPTYFHVQLQMKPLWTERTDGPWLYVEQAMATAPEKPYRQRVYRVTRTADGKLASVVYTLPGDALKYAGAWKHDKPLADLKPTDLIERVGCMIFLTAQADGTYKGATAGKDCASDLRGATYATSEVVLSATQLTSWDRGFDKADVQAWGATKGPYIFKKIPAK
jgi:hypothetical protein